MTGSLTYVEFLSAFLAVPAVGLTVAVARRTEAPRRVVAGVAALVCIAVAYTAPWDSYLVGRGVWTYGEGVVAARFARVPLGEWLFFVLQTVTTGLWYHLLAPRVDPGVPGRDAPGRADARTVGAVAWLALAALGAVLTVSATRTYYLGMILVWAGPVVAFLWAVGGPVVWRYRRLVAARSRFRRRTSGSPTGSPSARVSGRFRPTTRPGFTSRDCRSRRRFSSS
ncbi:lycopene cyclase domain-containing protein [Halorussus sp. MSC15.2]|uniref:lycopene cyclase domain-containing protein n=1 Tax=Halorussus sp. MSC15.2 TaxID=2283638 RepID=UPI0013D5CE34|nr:lycopene cyclase domain-containing protein [Halorussus sp. MSC15.2]NEU57816.1 lycopene cyclase domain-containing protein [Halorussus sp. MSC15.2]